MTGKVTVLQGQSILDVAVQSTGSVEAAFNLAVKNDLSITDILETGNELEKVDVIDQRIRTYYDNWIIQPSTFQPDGIEYTGIEYDFIIE